MLKKFILSVVLSVIVLFAGMALQPAPVDAHTGTHYFYYCYDGTKYMYSRYGTWNGYDHNWSPFIRQHGAVGICY